MGRSGLLASLSIAALASPGLGFEIVSTAPSTYALGISSQLSTIEVTFDAPVALPSVAPVRVAGAMSGLHTGTIEVAGNVLRWRRGPRPFMPGELVNVNLRAAVQSTGGQTLAGGRYFAFTIASTRCIMDWSTWTSYGTADVPYFIHGGDLDGDGWPDLAVPNEGSNDVSIFKNDAGNGAFPIHSEYDVGVRPSSIFGEDYCFAAA